jgi:5'-3' exonuclease
MTKPMNTKVIIDFNPLVYAMKASIEPLTHNPCFQSESPERQMEILKLVINLNVRLITSLACMQEKRPGDYQVIFVTDKKVDGKYWRHGYLSDPSVIGSRQSKIDESYAKKCEDIEVRRANGIKGLRKPTKPKQAEPIAYKGGRKQLSELHSNIVTLMRASVTELGYTLIGISNYEADDIAAALVRLNAGRSYTWLMTIDTDWLGLVNDNVGWFCQIGYAPRVRDSMKQVNVWSERRLKTTFNVAREIWDYKAEVGDKTDNLPVFSPLEVIDLCQPPAQYDLLQNPEYSEHLERVLQSEKNDAHLVFDGASRQLATLGLTPIVPLIA